MTPSILHRIARRIARRFGHLSSGRSCAPWKAAAAAVALALGATAAAAAIVSTTPVIVQFTPNSVVLNQRESDILLLTFDERQNFVLPVNFTTDQGVILAGTCVSSHFIHGDAKTAASLGGQVRFQSDILGVISDPAGLDDTDGPLGKNNVDYPNHPVPMGEINRGLEPADSYSISPGGRAIDVLLDLNSFSDQLRVLTSCP